MKIKVAIVTGIFTVLAAALAAFIARGEKSVEPTTFKEPEVQTIDSDFFPSGWMGDGEDGSEYIQFTRETIDIAGKKRVAIKINYTPGPKGWAGLYWLYPENNWGKEPGRDLTGIKQITFLAKGIEGTEIVEFKSGGVQGEHGDTFEYTLGKKLLSNEWKEFSIDLTGRDLSNVVGPFAWICAASDNTNNETSFYIAEINLER